MYTTPPILHILYNSIGCSILHFLDVHFPYPLMNIPLLLFSHVSLLLGYSSSQIPHVPFISLLSSHTLSHINIYIPTHIIYPHTNTCTPPIPSKYALSISNEPCILSYMLLSLSLSLSLLLLLLLLLLLFLKESWIQSIDSVSLFWSYRDRPGLAKGS